MTRLPTPSRAAIIEGSVETDARRHPVTQFDQAARRKLKGGRSLSSSQTFVPLAREQPVEGFVLHGPDRRPEAVTRGPCPYCSVRSDIGCRHQKPYRENSTDV